MSNSTRAIVLVFVYAACLLCSALVAKNARSAKRTMLLHSILIVFEPLVFLGYAAIIYSVSPLAALLSLVIGAVLFVYFLRIRRSSREKSGIVEG